MKKRVVLKQTNCFDVNFFFLCLSPRPLLPRFVLKAGQSGHKWRGSFSLMKIEIECWQIITATTITTTTATTVFWQ